MTLLLASANGVKTLQLKMRMYVNWFFQYSENDLLSRVVVIHSWWSSCWTPALYCMSRLIFRRPCLPLNAPILFGEELQTRTTANTLLEVVLEEKELYLPWMVPLLELALTSEEVYEFPPHTAVSIHWNLAAVACHTLELKVGQKFNM